MSTAAVPATSSQDVLTLVNRNEAPKTHPLVKAKEQIVKALTDQRWEAKHDWLKFTIPSMIGIEQVWNRVSFAETLRDRLRGHYMRRGQHIDAVIQCDEDEVFFYVRQV